jgi:hypothetical protein
MGASNFFRNIQPLSQNQRDNKGNEKSKHDQALYLLLKHSLFTACKKSFSKTEECTHCCREGAQAVVLYTDGQSVWTGHHRRLTCRKREQPSGYG